MRPRYDLHCTAPSSDPPDDRLADAEPALGNRVHVEPVAMIAHEDLNLVGAGLAIHGDGLAAMRYGVDERLLRGIEQRVGLGTGPRVAHGHHFDRFAVLVFRLRGDGLQPGADRTVRCGAFLIQPFAQFALLLPGEREHGLRVVAVQLDQGERLQHAIVQVRGHVGTFLFTLLECALGG